MIPSNKRLFFITIGPIEDTSIASRIFGLTDVIRGNFKDCSIINLWPAKNKYENNQKYKIKQLSFFVNYKSPIIRYVQVLVGHLRFLVWIVFRTGRKDILYFYSPTVKSSLLGLIIGKFLNKYIVCDIVERFSYENQNWLVKHGDISYFKYATVPFAISNLLIAFGQKYASKKITKLPIVVDFERFDNTTESQKSVIGYVGTSASKDGLNFVLKGFSEAYKVNKSLKLRLIGPKPAHFEFDALVSELGIIESIELTGSKSFNEIPILLLACDTFIMNRDNSSSAQYGYPTKLGEYFACNRPVLMSNGPGFSEDFQDRVEAIKYEANTPQALADAIIWRYENDHSANEIAQRGYDYAKNHFSKEVVGEIFIKTLREEGVLK